MTEAGITFKIEATEKSPFIKERKVVRSKKQEARSKKQEAEARDVTDWHSMAPWKDLTAEKAPRCCSHRHYDDKKTHRHIMQRQNRREKKRSFSGSSKSHGFLCR